MRSMNNADIEKFIKAIQANRHKFDDLLASATDMLLRAVSRHRRRPSASPRQGGPCRDDTSQLQIGHITSVSGQHSAPIEAPADRHSRGCEKSSDVETSYAPRLVPEDTPSDTFPTTPAEGSAVETPNRFVLSSESLDDLMRAASGQLIGNATTCAWVNKYHVWPSTIFSGTADDDVACTWFPQQDSGQDGHKAFHLLPYLTHGRWRLACFDTSQHTVTCYDSAWRCDVENGMYNVCGDIPSDIPLC